MQLEKVREAAGRVAGSVGLEIFDVEWKVGKDRLLQVYIDRLPGPQNPEGLGVTHKDCERVSEQLSVILDVEDLVPGPSYVLEVSRRRHTRLVSDWSSDVCSSDLIGRAHVLSQVKDGIRDWSVTGVQTCALPI